jgi:uncharacterized protein YbjT (DUF2867 family)
MNIAIIGGSGFIGRHIAEACKREGNHVTNYARKSHAAEDNLVAIDLREVESVAIWKARLTAHKTSAVINCVGILKGTNAEMDAVHHRSSAAIALACREMKIPFLHVSMLGFYDSPDTPYFVSKRRGEEAIRVADPGAIIVRPSVIFGDDSPATKLMLQHAASPLFVLPQHTKPIAPVHIDDVAQLCAYLITTLRAQGRDIDVVGDAEMSIAGYLARLREAKTPKRARLVKLPNKLFRFAASAASKLGSKTFCPEVVDLMEHAHIGRPGAIHQWLHHPAKPVAEFQRA